MKEQKPTYRFVYINKDVKMKTRMFFTITALILLTTGCVSRYQYQVDQSLLVQENQKLENALYVTHHQLVDVQRENEELRNQVSTAPTTQPSRPARREQVPPDTLDVPPEFNPGLEIPSKTNPATIVPPIGRKLVENQYQTQDDATVATFPTWSPQR
ncbi:MAG: hypothetical protein LBU65_15515 [Planctomycetaceae bacterium]|jgi:hypothetical protein|nr:hypothetical protein [Planctomycetaceae bacterium]